MDKEAFSLSRMQRFWSISAILKRYLSILSYHKSCYYHPYNQQLSCSIYIVFDKRMTSSTSLTNAYSCPLVLSLLTEKILLLIFSWTSNIKENLFDILSISWSLSLLSTTYHALPLYASHLRVVLSMKWSIELMRSTRYLYVNAADSTTGTPLCKQTMCSACG